jgi:hypothetical protein
VILTLSLLPASLHAQDLDWQPVEALDGELPASVRVLEAQNDTLRAWQVRASAAGRFDSSYRFDVQLSDEGGTETVTSFAEDAEAYVAVNGGYFGGGQSYSLVARGGNVRSPNLKALTRSAGTFYPTRAALASLEGDSLDTAWIYDVGGEQYFYPQPNPNERGDPAPQPSASQPEGGAPWPLRTGVGGGPMLIEGGERQVTWEKEVFFGSGIGRPSEKQPRTAIGYTAEGDLLMVVVDGRQAASEGATLYELAGLMASLGAVEAINLDGGGSSTIAAADSLLNRPGGSTFQRDVASAVLLTPPDDGGGTPSDSSLYFDTGDACCYRETGTWITSANTPFYGDTKARLNETGSGDDRAVFTFEGIEARTYDLAAWWVASTNRATNTPFTVYHDGDSAATVCVDQTDAATLNQWNELGSFELSPGDSVVVTDDASGDASPAYVNVDALRLQPALPSAIEETASPRASDLTLYPNPAMERLTLRFRARRPGAVRGRVVNVLGREVHRFERETRGGAQQLRVRLPDLPAGAYAVQLRTPAGHALTAQVVVL